jgi:ABC-2 type transport system ATP-binding protein/lipopolysaccharide transport system ATP-binding protein
MDQFWDGETTVLVVSHSMEFISESCNQAIWINKGKIVFSGNSSETVDYYLNSVAHYEIN